MEMIEIFFDTSILKEKSIKDYSMFTFGRNYLEFIDFINTNDLSDKCHINVTEIVMKELKCQICEKFEEDDSNYRELLSKFRVFYGIDEPEKVKDFETGLDRRINDYLEQEKINMVLIPKERDTLNNLLDRAIYKNKPFSGKNGESDKGFKDAVQWESMLQYAGKIASQKFLFLTKNKNDFPEELSDDFERITGKKIEIFYELGELQNRLLEINQIQSNYLLVDANIDSLLDSGELFDIVNEKIKLYYNFEVNSIVNYSDLIDQSNNNYSFNIEVVKDEENLPFHIECRLDKDGNINIDDVIMIA